MEPLQRRVLATPEAQATADSHDSDGPSPVEVESSTYSVWRFIGGTLLNLAALGGAVFIVLIVLAVVFNITLILFKTGSMSPTIPAGSLAVVKEIPASQIRVGDVLTVDRGEQLPVTHRVTSVAGTGPERIITMQGDANDSEDPLPYTVTEVKRVLVAVPGLAHVVVWFSNPVVLGALTIATSVLVTWAFWPREQRDRARRNKHKAIHTAKHGGGLALGAILVGSTLVLHPAAPVEALYLAEPRETVTRGEHLTLTSIGDPTEMLSMQPGVPVLWQVGVAVTPRDPGNVEVAVSAQGSDELGLVLGYQLCSERWVGTQCPGNETSISAPESMHTDDVYRPLFDMSAGETQAWLLVTATIPEPAKGRVDLSVQASGANETVTAGPGPAGTLADTGDEPIWSVLLGVTAVCAGLVVAGLATARKKAKQMRSAS